jgi:hypothetical protein
MSQCTMRQPKADDTWVASIEPIEDVFERRAAITWNVIDFFLGPMMAGTKEAVIRRRDDGEQVFRGDAGPDTVWMLDQLQRDLRSMSEEAFTAKWDSGTDWPTILANLR